jgi:arsenate reductase
MKILFLCTHNRCRSILAEALFNHFAPAGVRGYSAGSEPKGEVHPRTLALLKRKGVATEGLYSKSWDDLADLHPDIVITVCDNAAGEACPIFFGAATKGHWGVPDPSQISGSDEQVNAAFDSTYQRLAGRIKALLALPLNRLDRSQLEAELDRIGNL